MTQQPKIALLLFGQPRDIETPAVYESHKRQFIDKYKTDVFCQYWWTPELKSYPVSNWSASRPSTAAVPTDVPALIQSRYKPVATLCLPPPQFTNCESVCEIIRTGYVAHKHGVPQWIRPQIIYNMQSQLCAIQTAVEFFEAHCASTGAKYDFVVIARYDLVIGGMPDLGTLPRDRITLMGHHPRFPDLIFVVPSHMLESQKTFANFEKHIVTGMTRLGSSTFWEPSVECLKFQQFLACGWTVAEHLNPVATITGDRVS